MKVLMTSILCHSGLMTHVQDLLMYCKESSIQVGAAFLETEYVTPAEADELKQGLTGIEVWEYETEEELLEIVNEGDWDIIHAHSFLTFKAAAKAAAEAQIPLIVTLHSVFVWGAVYWDVLAEASSIIAVGPAQARYLGPWKRKTTVIPNGIDLSVFKPGDEPSDGQISVLWYGRVDGRMSRGLKILDAMAPKLPAEITLRAVGQADVELKNIPITGWVKDPVEELQRSHITFAHGRSLREAMACGSIGMMLGHGYGGRVTRELLEELNYATDAFPQYHLPRPTPDALLHDILEITTSGQIEVLRRQARQIAEEFFGVKSMGRKTLSVYQEALGQK